MFEVRITLPSGELGKVRQFLEDVAKHFEDAMKLGFFLPASLMEPIVVQTTASDFIKIEVRAIKCPPGAIRILLGMCEWGRLVAGLPIEEIRAYRDEVPIEAVSNGSREFALRDIPFKLKRPRFLGDGEQIVVHIRFGRVLSEDQVELLEQGIDIWAALLQGGMPPHGAPPGNSGIGAISGYFIAPLTYQLHVEALAADNKCIDLLVAFFTAQMDKVFVESVEVEA